MAKRATKRPRQLLFVTLVFTTFLVFFAIFMDVIESQFQDSVFYFSESVLFSSFWWLFAPLLYIQFVSAPSCRTKGKKAILIFLPVAIHLIAFPALVWLLSYLYYYHTFSFIQTFIYGLTTHFITVVLMYSLPISFYKFYISKSRHERFLEKPKRIDQPISSLIIIDGKRQISIKVADILYFSANPPYVNIHHGTKKHLSNDTLKSIYSRVDDDMFVQIHKSVIVNIAYVNYYESRHNGDYDLVMNNEKILRVSRNYARDFKTKFRARHQDTA